MAIKRAVEEEEKILAKGRQRAHGGTAPGKKNTSANLALVNGKARVKAANGTGKSHTSLSKAEQIIAASEKEPDKFGGYDKLLT